MAIKAYYTFNWPTKWRFGVAEGMSYIDNITYIEGTEMEEKGYTPSNLLNYLDFSLDVNVGDLFNQKDWENMWVGYSLHHRSAIFGTPLSLAVSKAAVTTIRSTSSTIFKLS